MEAVFNVLSSVLGAVAGFFTMLGDLHALTIELFAEFGVGFFMFGFFGLLMTFLWFLFRFLDKKRLVFPTIVFTFFFLIFLSGNLLMLSQQTRTEKNNEQKAAQTQLAVPEDAAAL